MMLFVVILLVLFRKLYHNKKPNSKIPKIEEIPEIPETSMNNVIQIDGHSYTLTPVKK